MTISQPTQTYAQQLLPTVLDQRARNTPDNVFAKVPRSPTSYSQGFRAVKYSELTNAISHVAWLIEQEFGKPEGFPTITYLGPSDLRYSIIVVAAIKVGYKIFLPSPRNSLAGHISLLSRLQCSRLVVTKPELPCVSQIEGQLAVHKLAIPSLAELLDLQNVPNYPYLKSYDEAKSDPVFILHTSGSTGIPKPLTYTNSFVSGIAMNTSLAPPAGFQMLDRHFRSGSFFMTLPAFHVAGIGFSLIVPSFQSSVAVYPLSTAPPTTEGLLEAASNTEIDWAFVPPVVIEQLARDPALLDDAASKLKYLFYTGGSVSQASGDTVIQKLGIYQCLGSSECATFPLIRPSSDETCADWRYVQIHPAVKHEFRHRFEDLYELVVVRDDVNHEQLNQPVFGHFPGATEYATRDLFAPHPTKPGLWTHESRADDVIVFLNGEKTNPISFEQAVTRHPKVKAALVGGSQRFEAFLLIELSEPQTLNEDERRQLLDRLWPTIAEANSSAPAHARIAKNKVLFSCPEMPFPRAGKGTVQRTAALDLYQKQIDELYVEPEIESSALSPRTDLDWTKPDSFKAIVESLVKEITSWTEIGFDDEFFGRGMDSLQVLRLTRELKTTFGLSNLAVRSIYANPTVDLLTEELSKVATGKGQGLLPREEQDTKVLENLLETYTRQIDDLASSLAIRTPRESNSSGSNNGTETGKGGRVILLTGSTGTLGSYLLHQLLSDPGVAYVLCLNRSDDSRTLQQSRNSNQHQLATDLSPERVSFFTADLSRPGLGLDKSGYHYLYATTTEIIHCAWPVDFNKSIHSFRASLDGVLNLAAFAATAKHSPSLLFISSISAVSSYKTTDSPSTTAAIVPETIIDDLTAPASMGYGQSKYLAERILDMTVRKFRIRAGILRVGQVCGTSQNDPRGWNRNEWFPSLVLSSKYLGLLPASLGSKSAEYPEGVMGTVDWIPVDRLPAVIVEVARKVTAPTKTNKTDHSATTASATTATPLHEDSRAQVFHAVNPATVRWSGLVGTVQQALQQKTKGQPDDEVRIVPFEEWLGSLRCSSSGGSSNHAGAFDADSVSTQQNPGVKLLEFYESLLLSNSGFATAPTTTDSGGSQQQQQFQQGLLARLDLSKTIEVSQTLASLEAIKSEWVSGWVEKWISSSSQ